MQFRFRRQQGKERVRSVGNKDLEYNLFLVSGGMFSLRYPDPSRAPVAPASGERPDSSGKDSWNRGRHLGLHLGSVCRYWVSHCEQVYEGGIGVCGQLDDFPAGNVPGDLETGIGIEFFLFGGRNLESGEGRIEEERAQGSDSVSPFSDSRISGRNCMVEKKWKGNFTVEAAILASALVFIVYGIIMALFYYHDKNILTGTTYETAVIAGRKQKRESPFSEEEVKQLWRERISGKMILFRKAEVEIRCHKEYVSILAQASRKKLRITASAKAALTEPEDRIRSIRKQKDAVIPEN